MNGSWDTTSSVGPFCASACLNQLHWKVSVVSQNRFKLAFFFSIRPHTNEYLSYTHTSPLSAHKWTVHVDADKVWDALYRSVLGQRSPKTGLHCLDAMPSRARFWSLVRPNGAGKRNVSLVVDGTGSGRCRYVVTPGDPILNVLVPGSWSHPNSSLF